MSNGQIRYQIGFDVDKTNLNQLKASLQEIQKLKISDVMSINSLNTQEATTELNKIKQQAKNVQTALKQAFNTKLNTVNVEEFNQSLIKTGSSINQVYSAFSKAGPVGLAAFRNLSSQVLSVNTQLRESHALLDKMATTLANTVKWNIASGAINAVTRSIQQAWGYAQSLDTSLNDIRIVTGKSADEMAEFAVQANKAAQELGKTTTDYTNAALIYAQQGLSDEEVQARARITLKAANVTGQSTDAVSEQLTAVWNGYKVSADEAELYIDRLAAVAATTASDLEELSTGMSKVASAAAAMGVGEDQLAAQLSTIISATRQAPESVGTALRTVYARISDIKAGIDEDGVTLGNYSSKMEKLGFSVLDMNGNLRDMGEVMEEIGNKWSSLTREQQVYLAQTMAGQRQYNNLLALFDNFEKYNEALNTARNAAGTLQKQQDTYMEGTKAHLNTLKASVEGVYDSLIDTDGINKIIDGLSKAAGFVETFVDGLGGGANVLKSLGAIGLTVFSEQIARGINTTITNLEIAKNNANQFSMALQATRQWQGIPGLDQVSKDLLKNREQLLQFSSLMTPEQFSGMQDLLNKITETGNKIAELESQSATLDRVANSVAKMSEQWTNAEGVMQDSEGRQKVIASLEEEENEIEGLTKAIEQYSKTQNSINIKRINGDDFSTDLEQAKNSINSYINKLDELNNKNLLSDNHKQIFENIKNQWHSLDQTIKPEDLASKMQIIVGKLKSISAQTQSTVSTTREAIVAEAQGTETALSSMTAKQVEELQKFLAQYEAYQERLSRAATIQNITNVVSGITSLSMAVQRFQNLGSIWKNQDLTTGEKLLQIISGLGMTVGMIIPAFTKLNKALNLVTISKKKEAAASLDSAVANGVEAGALNNTGIAGEKAAAGITLFNGALTINPIFASIAAIAALIAILDTLIKKQEEARKSRIEENQAIIESENKKQEQIQTNKKLYNSLEQLDKKYKDGQINRTELKNGVVDLINQYNLEEDKIKSLTNSYDNLTQAIIRKRKADAEEGVGSTTTEKGAAEVILADTAKGSKAGKIDYSGAFTTFDLDFKKGNDPEELIQLMIEDGWNELNGHMDNPFTLFDTKSILQQYDQVAGYIEEMNARVSKGTMDAIELNNSKLYQNMKKWLDQMQPAVTQYRQALEDLEKYEIDKVVDYQGLFNVDDQAGYLQERAELIAQIYDILDKNGDDVSKAANMADTYLRENFSSLYSQFGEAGSAVDKFAEKFEKTTDDVNKEIGKLNQKQLAALLEMPDSVLKDWSAFQAIVEKISKTDFSNVHRLSDVNVMQQNAEQGYVSAKELQDTVSSGKNISTEMFNSLSDDMKEFFSRTADGTYKMTGDAKTFYEMVNNMKLDGFSAALHQIEQQQTLLQQPLKDFFSENNITYDDIDQSAVSPNVPSSMTVGSADYNNMLQGAATGEATEELVNQQLAYLQTVSATNPALKTMVDQWREQISEQGISMQLAEDIADKVSEIGDVTNQLDEKWEQVAYQMHEAMFPTDEDVDKGVLQNLSETIQETSDEIDGLADRLSDVNDEWAARDAEEVAESFLRFDDAILDVVDHYDEWMAALTSGSVQDQAEAMDGLRDVYQDLLDLDGSSLSESFLKSTKNLELMQQAINGDKDSYNQLMAAAQEDIISHIHFSQQDFDNFTSKLEVLQDQMAKIDLKNLEVGASLNDEGFLAALEDVINAAHMTAEQATDYLKTMGIDATVVQAANETEQVQSQTGWDSELVENTATGSVPIISGRGADTIIDSQPLPYTVYNTQYTPHTETVTTPVRSAGFGLKITNGHVSAGGDIKFAQAKHGNGSGASARTKKSGGGGGGGSKSKSTSTKDTKKPIEDTRDIYHDINIEIQQINRNLKRVQQQQDRLYGKQLLDNLNKQSKILDQHKEKLAEKLELQKWDLAQQRQILEGLDVTFDKYGNIANYMDVLGDKQAQVNALIAEENKLIEQYNATADSDAQKQIGDQITAQEKKVKEAEDEFKELQNKIKSYDSLREAMEDVVDDIEEATQKQIELNIQKFRMELEIRLDMGEAERDWNEFRRNVLEHSDVIKDTEFDGIFKDALQNLRDATSYFDVHGSKGSIQNLTEQLIATRNQIQAIDELGKSAIYGDNKAQAMEDLQSDLDELMSQIQDVESLIDDIDNAYLDTIDDVQDQFDKQIEDYEYIGDLIDHDISLLQLLYGDKNYDAMEKYYETLERNNLNQIDSLRQQRDFWGQQWEAAAARGDTQAAKQFEQNFREALQNLNQVIEDAAQTIQDKYINAIDKIFDELDKKISNGMGTDYLGMQWDLMNKNADEYLDTINSAFAIQETERKYQNAITDAKSIKNQQALKQLMDEQLGILRNKEKITQYDIDRAEKLLQVEQARIALEDAQAAKTTMRLKRDSQGNYSYEYMADEGAIGEAEANLAQAQNDLYNFDKERYQSNLDDMLAAWKDFQSEYKDIVEDVSLSEEERVAKLALLREQYGEYINDKTAENAVIRGNLMQSAFADLALLYETDVENYNNMSLEEQNILMGELVPAWTSGIQQMSDTVAGEGGFIPTCQEAFDNITEATLLYEDELNNMAQTAGTNFENIKNGVDETAAAFEDLIENNEELTARLKDEMDAVSLLRAQVHALVEEYQAVYDAAKLATTAVHDFIQAQQNQAAAAAEAEKNALIANSGSNSTTPTAGSKKSTNSTNANNAITSSSTNRNVSGSTSGEIYSPSSGSGNSTGSLPPSLWESSMAEQRDVNQSYTGSYGGTDSVTEDYLRKLHRLVTFATGGYTGDWIDDNGRLAVLHQKELVLNAEDTKNILDSVSIMRAVMSNMSGNLAMRLGNIRTGLAQMMDGYNDGIEQNVHIDASFPNVNSKREIEEAFNDLVNLAAQRALRR